MNYNVIILCFILLYIASCSSKNTIEESPQEEHYISLTNDIAQSRKDEPIVITRDHMEDLTKRFPQGQVPRLIGENGEEIPVQTDDMDGDGEWDELSFTYSILPKYTAVLKVETVEMALSSDYDKKTNLVVYNITEDQKSKFSEAGNSTTKSSPGRAALSGISWENDKIAFYIDFHPEPVKYILGKRTDKMILNKIDIQSGSMEQQVWGKRFFNRFDSIGSGTLTYLQDSIISKFENYDSLKYQIITQGPVRSTFKIIYQGVQTEDSKYNVEEEVTIWAMQNGYQNKISISGIEKEQVLAAVVPISSFESFVRNDTDPNFHSIASFNISDKEASGIGMLIPRLRIINYKADSLQYNEDLNFHYVKFNISNQEPILIFVYAGWQYQDEKFKEPEGFLTMLEKEANRINNPLVISNKRSDEE
ncbi:MAG: DUF4861 domain-containing protein [Bacteroidota bacterium]|nr:DUF4861 domain-containing protein [Bacteroidota bacterium]